MTTPVRIVVVDDHHLFRAGVIELLQSVPEFDIAAEGATGVEAVTLTHQAKPDIVLLDVEMPGPGATATIRKILEASPRTRIVILTMHDDADIVRDLLDAGASGYLLKSAGRSELIAGITAAARTDDAIMISVSRNTALQLGRTPSVPEPTLLSAREYEVLTLLATAHSNRDIARQLHITDATVKRHLANIYAKLGATSRLDAVRKAGQRGILPATITDMHT
jgi:DNA-binding NarL/FixJ family response regulator